MPTRKKFGGYYYTYESGAHFTKADCDPIVKRLERLGYIVHIEKAYSRFTGTEFIIWSRKGKDWGKMSASYPHRKLGRG